MKKVRIQGRGFPHGGRFYGKGGDYTVDDKTAKAWQEAGKAEIIENLGTDEEYVPPEPGPQKNPQFLQMVQDHASEIFDVMMQEGQRREDENSQRRQKERESEEFPPFEDEGQSEEDNGENTNNSDSGDENNSSSSSRGFISDNQSIGTNVPSGTENVPNTTQNQEVDSDLPEDFPSRKILIDAGYSTIEQVSSLSREELTAIEGIGDRKANAIGVRLEEMKSQG